MDFEKRRREAQSNYNKMMKTIGPFLPPKSSFKRPPCPELDFERLRSQRGIEEGILVGRTVVFKNTSTRRRSSKKIPYNKPYKTVSRRLA